jgi:hypothetical protein
MFKKEKTKTKKMIERITQSVVYILLLRGCLFCTVENQGKGAPENFFTRDGKLNKKLPHNKLVFKS